MIVSMSESVQKKSTFHIVNIVENMVILHFFTTDDVYSMQP